MANRIALPEPRRYDPAPDSPLAAEAMRLAAMPAALQQGILYELSERVTSLLLDGEEAAVRAALAAPGSRAAGEALLTAVGRAIAPPPADTGVQTRVFALPLLLVAGGRAGARVPGVIADPGAIELVFAQAGALGHARNVGFSNALVARDALEAVSLARLCRLARGEAGTAFEALDLPPADVELPSAEESVHLRFIVGAMLVPADAPGLAETGSDIARWGMSLTRALAAQLAVDGVSLLPMARPPAGLLEAARVGRFTAQELGVQLFLSKALRDARLRSGDPEATVSAHADGSVRVRLTSVFDERFDRSYCWPLAPLDDLAAISDSILGLLAECRLERVEVLDTVQAAPERG